MKHKIKGDIISWNSSIWDFNQKMKSIKEDENIELEINSYGGDVFLGIDIMNTLRGHKGEVSVTITGIAASAASVIIMGADKIKAYGNTQIMLHNAWTFAMGNSKELRKVADDLESINESVLASYTHRLDADKVKKLLDDETYLSASKALELGLIDEIIDLQTEEVESKIFENKAKEFNNKIEKQFIASAKPSFEEVQADLEELRAELNLFKNQQTKAVDPITPEPKKNNFANLFTKLN